VGEHIRGVQVDAFCIMVHPCALQLCHGSVMAMPQPSIASHCLLLRCCYECDYRNRFKYSRKSKFNSPSIREYFHSWKCCPTGPREYLELTGRFCLRGDSDCTGNRHCRVQHISSRAPQSKIAGIRDARSRSYEGLTAVFHEITGCSRNDGNVCLAAFANVRELKKIPPENEAIREYYNREYIKRLRYRHLHADLLVWSCSALLHGDSDCAAADCMLLVSMRCGQPQSVLSSDDCTVQIPWFWGVESHGISDTSILHT
jgi:hypothetical protein